MNIRSIDLQVLIPRAAEASKVQQISDQQNNLQQQQQAAEWKQIAANRQHQVQSSPKSVGGKVEGKNKEESEKRRNKNNTKDSNPHSDTQEQMQDGTDPLRGHHVDIKT